MMYKNLVFVFILLFIFPALKAQDYHLRALVNAYKPDYYNERARSVSVSLQQGENYLSIGESSWKVLMRKEKSNDESNNFIIRFECLYGYLENASVSVDFIDSTWSKDNYLLMPAAVYAGNRFPSIKMPYMPFWNDPSQLGIDKPILLSDQPKLNEGKGPSQIQVRSGSMSIPSVGYKCAHKPLGHWLFFDQGNGWGDYGVTVTENKQRSTGTISITSPVVREKTKYFIADNTRASDDVPANFEKGDSIIIRFKVVNFNADEIQDVFNTWATYRKTYRPVREKDKVLPLSTAFKIIEKKFNTQNWRESGYYAVGTNDNFFQDWQIGWVGGMITTLPLLLEGNSLSKKRSLSNFDWLFENGISPSGYYYDVIYKNRPYGAFPNKALGDSLHLVRKNADATYYIYKQFLAMRKLGIQVKKEWEKGNESALNAQIKTWRDYGQLGQFVNQETGKLVIGNTTSAGIFPAALCAAYAYTGKSCYLEYAKEIADYYYTNFISKGLTCGGPGDAMQSFDSESSYGLLVSLVDLFEITRDSLWLDRAEDMAIQFSTWVVGYDFDFPENSLYAKLNIRTNGSVYANTQNQHAAPGICTHSGEALLKLYRFTGDEYYLNLVVDIVHNLPQYLSTKERPIDCLQEGWVSERVNMTDWLEGIGETFCGSTWAETALLLSALELPGVYVRQDLGLVKCFEHVEASLIRRAGGSMSLKITNPTDYDCTIKMLIEDETGVKKNLGYNSNLQWKKVELAKGDTKIIQL